MDRRRFMGLPLAAAVAPRPAHALRLAPGALRLEWRHGALTRALELPASAAVHDPTHAREVPRGQIDALTHSMTELRVDGAKTVDYVTLYRNHVLPVEQVLRRRGISRATARRVAWPLVQHASRKKVDPATVVSVLLIESEGNPHATSKVGAKGLMQVMPTWAGQWRGCGSNLYAIDDNLCTGTSLLAWYLNRADGDRHRALLGYNGCVLGTNPSRCISSRSPFRSSSPSSRSSAAPPSRASS